MIKYGQCTSRKPEIRAMYREQKIYEPPKPKEPKKPACKSYSQGRVVWVDGVKYESITVAAYTGYFTASGLRKAMEKGYNSCNGHTIKYEGCQGKTPAPSARPVVVDGVRYPSISLAAEIMQLQEGRGTQTSLASALRAGKSKFCGHTIAYAPQRV